MRTVEVKLLWEGIGRQHPLAPSAVRSTYWPVAQFDSENQLDDSDRPAWSVEITALTAVTESGLQSATLRYVSESAPEVHLVFGARFQLMEGPNVVAQGVVVEP